MTARRSTLFEAAPPAALPRIGKAAATGRPLRQHEAAFILFYRDIFNPPRAAAALDDSPVEKVTPHTLRHTFASLVALFGTVQYLSRQLGHSSLSATQRYLHMFDDSTGRERYASMDDVITRLLLGFPEAGSPLRDTRIPVRAGPR